MSVKNLTQAGRAPTDADMELRRVVALELAREGLTQTAIAKKLKASQPSVSRWIRGTVRVDRAPAVSATLPDRSVKPASPGRAPLLSDDELREVYDSRPAHDWTGASFRLTLIEAFSVAYSLNHSCGLLKRLRTGSGTRFDATHVSHAKPLEGRGSRVSFPFQNDDLRRLRTPGAYAGSTRRRASQPRYTGERPPGMRDDRFAELDALIERENRDARRRGKDASIDHATVDDVSGAEDCA